MNAHRRTAIVVGVLYIVGTVAGALSMVVQGRFSNAADPLKMVAAHAGQAGLVAFLLLVMGLVLAMVPVMMFPILKRQNEAMAVGYVVFRGALETLGHLAVAMCWLLLVVAARQSADSGAAVSSQLSSLGILFLKARDPIIAVAFIVFSVGALMFYSLLYQARLIPRWIPAWGIVAAVPYLAGALIAVFTGTLLVPLLLPLAVQEMVMAVWLIAKGFSTSDIAAQSDRKLLAA